MITRWGSYGGGDGQFDRPRWIAIDGNGDVYVTDGSRVQKFAANGKFITKWGSEGSGNGEFSFPTGITANSNGNIYVVDALNNRIQKFSSDGTFITKWGNYGSGDGEFAWVDPYYDAGIAIDGRGDVYVVDSGNNRIQKFSSDGAFITKWGSHGSGNGQFRPSQQLPQTVAEMFMCRIGVTPGFKSLPRLGNL